MVFSRGQDIQHEQEIVSAIRESLLQDPRIALLGGHHQEDNLTVQNKSYRAYGNIVPDPSINPSKRQSTAQGELIARDQSSAVPNACSVKQNPGPANLQSTEISSDSPSIAPDAHSMDPDLQQSIVKSEEVRSNKPSVAKRLFRTGACGFIITVIVGSAFAWQSSDDTAKETIKGWASSLVSPSSFLPDNSPLKSDVATEAGSAPSDPRPAAAPVILSADRPTSTASESPPDLQRQLETIVGDLALVRRIVEQVAARQDQMEQDIAKLTARQEHITRDIATPQTAE
jgi:hypothetical protein